MIRTLVLALFCAASASAVGASPKNPRVPENRSFFCDSCLKMTAGIKDFAGDKDANHVKKASEALCDDVLASFPKNYAAGCKQVLGKQLPIIQEKFTSGSSPESICKDFMLCA